MQYFALQLFIKCSIDSNVDCERNILSQVHFKIVFGIVGVERLLFGVSNCGFLTFKSVI